MTNYIAQGIIIFLLAVLLACEFKRQPQIKEVPVQVVVRSTEDSVHLAKANRSIRALQYRVDSLTMAHIRKDGLLGEPSSFITLSTATDELKIDSIK